MAISSETYNKDLYSLLKTKGYRPVPLDFKGEKTDPEQAVVFEFQFKKDGERYGVSYVTVDNDVTVYYDDEQTDSPSSPTRDLDYDDTWSGFLKQMKHWAMNKQLGFDLSNKDRLGDDLAQRKYVMDKEKINEGYYPMGKQASYSDAIPTVKIILQHTRQIQEGEQRYRNVSKIFLENQLGERILAPTVRPGIAQVYARHLAEGGVPNDERWNHIKGLCEEYSKMAGFVRAVKNNQFNESAQQLVNEGVNHYTSLRETLSRMRGHRGYNTYFESWTPTLMEDESEDNTINELFVQETLDPRIESVLPILSKLRKSVVEMKEVDELAEWAEGLTEAPGPMTYNHNKNTEMSNLKDFDLEEDDVQDELDAAELARKKIKIPPYKRGPLSTGDIEASKKHPSSSGVVGRLADEPKKTLEEKDVEDTDIEMKLTQLTKAPDIFDAIYDALTGDDDLGPYLQDMYIDIAREGRLHPDDDFEVIITRMADQLEDYYGKQGVEEGSEQTNESLDRLLHLANINNPKKVDESVDDDMFSLSGKVPPTDRIHRDSLSGQDIQKAIVDKIEQQTINRLLDKYPNLKPASFKGKSLPKLIQMLREAVKKPNATTRHLRDYPVSDKDVAKPVKPVKPEKKDEKKAVAEDDDNWSVEYKGKDYECYDQDHAINKARKFLGYDKEKNACIIKRNGKPVYSWRQGEKIQSIQDVAEGSKKIPASNKPVDPNDLLVSLKDVPVKTPRGHKKYDPAKEFPGVKVFQKQGVAEDLDANQKRVGQLGPTENVKNNNIGKLVGANESVNLSEMDSEGHKGHRGDEDSGKGPEKSVKPVKAKYAAKDAKKVLDQAMDKAHKKDVKEGQEDLDAILRIIRK